MISLLYLFLPLKNGDKLYLFDKLIEAGADINYGKDLPYVLISTLDEKFEFLFDCLLDKNVDMSYYLVWNLCDLMNMVLKS